jgi:two-component system, OmpR family, KDP operon response regulator KdpE
MFTSSTVRALIIDASEPQWPLLRRSLAPLRWDLRFEREAERGVQRLMGEPIVPILLVSPAMNDQSHHEIQLIRVGGRGMLGVIAPKFSDDDATRAFDAGADDVIREPWRSPLFLARCSSLVLRHRFSARCRCEPAAEYATPNRERPTPPAMIQIGPIVIDTGRRRVIAGDRSIRLTPTEFLILERLAQTPDEPVSERDLVQKVLSEPFRPPCSIARVHIHRMRKKLGQYAAFVQSVHPHSYCLVRDWQECEKRVAIDDQQQVGNACLRTSAATCR